jgi:hypothetical protein
MAANIYDFSSFLNPEEEETSQRVTNFKCDKA